MRRGLAAFAVGVWWWVAVASAGAASWSLQSPPNPSGAKIQLNAMSCMSVSACTAVGSYISSATSMSLTLAERWNGSVWAIQPTPVPPPGGGVLTGVSCVSLSSCFAVGYSTDQVSEYAPLAEHWDGSSWSIQMVTPLPNTSQAQLTAVSCTSQSACTAVGQGAAGGSPFAERWNGTSWSLQSVPRMPGFPTTSLTGVSCLPASCVAVGSAENGGRRPVSARWNGTSWGMHLTPSSPGTTFGFLTGVACPLASACTAVGSGSGPLALRGNGVTWSVQTVPSATAGEFDAVSCSSWDVCTAVGDYMRGSLFPATLAMRFSGSSWTIQGTPNAPGTKGDTLLGVSCPAIAACLAGGTKTLLNGFTGTLAEIWQ